MAQKKKRKASKARSKKAPKKKAPRMKARKASKRKASTRTASKKKAAKKRSAPARARKSAKPAARRAGKKSVAKKAAPARKASKKGAALEPWVVKPAPGKQSPAGAKQPRYSTGAPKPVGGMYGEGSWKADEGLAEFSASRDSEAPARESARDLERQREGFGKKGEKQGSEEDSEW